MLSRVRGVVAVQRRWNRSGGPGRVPVSTADFAEYKQIERKTLGSGGVRTRNHVRWDLMQLETQADPKGTPKVRLRTSHFTPEDELRIERANEKREERILRTRMMMIERYSNIAAMRAAKKLQSHQNRLRALITRNNSPVGPRIREFRQMQVSAMQRNAPDTFESALKQGLPEFFKSPAAPANTVHDFLDRTTRGNAVRSWRNSYGLGRDGARSQREAENKLNHAIVRRRVTMEQNKARGY